MFHIVQTMKLLQGLRLTVNLNKKNTHMFVCVCDKICVKLIYERERERGADYEYTTGEQL